MLRRNTCKGLMSGLLFVLMICVFSIGATGTKSWAVENPELEKIIKKATLVNIPPEQLDPVVVRALSRVKMKLSPQEEKLAYAAYKNQIYTLGPGKLEVGVADGFGDNVWRQFTFMEIVLQAMTYPDIGKIVYTNAHGKLEEAIANMRSLIAQKVDIIIGYFDLGDAMLPVMKEAMEQGIVVVPYVNLPPSAEIGVKGDFLSIPTQDVCAEGRQHGEYAVKIVGKKGTALFLTGVAGNPMSAGWVKCAKEVLNKYPGWKTMSADTSWTQQGAFEAVSGALATGKQIDVINSTYGNELRGAIRAYEQAGKPIPLIINMTPDGGLFKQWEELRGKNPDFRIFYTHGINWPARVALTIAHEYKTEGKVPPPKVDIPMPFAEIKPGVYNPNMPLEYGGTELVPESLIEKMFPKK